MFLPRFSVLLVLCLGREGAFLFFSGEFKISLIWANHACTARSRSSWDKLLPRNGLAASTNYRIKNRHGVNCSFEMLKLTIKHTLVKLGASPCTAMVVQQKGASHCTTLAGCQPHPATFSLPLLKNTEGENTIKRLGGWDKGREIT